MAISDRILYRISGTHTNVGANEETILQLPAPGGSGGGLWLLKSFHYVRSGGTAATYTPRLGQSAAWTDDDIDERMTYSVTNVGTSINEVFDADIPCKSDSSSRLFFRPGFNTGADNDGAYEFFFEQVRGA